LSYSFALFFFMAQPVPAGQAGDDLPAQAPAGAPVDVSRQALETFRRAAFNRRSRRLPSRQSTSRCTSSAIRGSARCRRRCAIETQSDQVQFIDEDVHDPNGVVFRNEVIQALRQQRDLLSVLTSMYLDILTPVFNMSVNSTEFGIGQ